MEVLDYIDLPSIEPEHVAQAVNKYIADRASIISSLDVKIRVSICKTQASTRAGKGERKGTLAQLISVTGTSKWKKGDYAFDFAKGKFMFGEKELHVTSGEAVALYQKLVRKQSTPAWSSFFSNMKKKLGADFLKGVL